MVGVKELILYPVERYHASELALIPAVLSQGYSPLNKKFS